jgi:very-short-patch-repair endonuclease
MLNSPILKGFYDRLDGKYPTIPCSRCSKPIIVRYKRKQASYVCPECFERNQFESNEARNKKQQKRLEDAKSYLLKRYGTIDDYINAFERIQDLIYKPGWFQSVNEILVALEFIRTKTASKHQVKISGYKVDFVLEQFKAIIEIDSLYHDAVRDKKRDRIIKEKIGSEWQIIRYDGEKVKANLKMLIPSIHRTLKRRDEKFSY